MTLSITVDSITTLSRIALSTTAFSTMMLSIMTLSITVVDSIHYNTEDNDIQHNGAIRKDLFPE